MIHKIKLSQEISWEVEIDAGSYIDAAMKAVLQAEDGENLPEEDEIERGPIYGNPAEPHLE